MMPNSNTNATSAYFQRGKSLMPGKPVLVTSKAAAPSAAADGLGWPEGSGRLQRALGQHLRDGALLQLDPHVRRDLDGEEALAHLFDAAGDAAVADDLVALGQRRHHGAVLLLALHLRADHQEVEDDE